MMPIHAVTETSFAPHLEDEGLLTQYQQDAQLWLQGSHRVAHWWSPDVLLLEQAVQTLVHVTHAHQPARLARVLNESDFLVLLRRLNGLIAASQPETVSDGAQEVWILARADQMSADHVDILRAICLHYPELGIRLACFSLSALAPVAAEGVHEAPISASVRGGAAQLTPAAVAGHRRRWPLAVLTAAVAGVLGLGVWWTGPSAPALSPLGAAQPSLEAASAPAEPAASAAPAASEPASAAVQPRMSEASSDAPMSASRRWLLGLPANSLVVVHAQVPTLREAEAFRVAGQPVLANARILLTVAQPGRPERYLVVTGPFRSPERVQGYLPRLKWKANATSVSREELLTQVPR